MEANVYYDGNNIRQVDHIKFEKWGNEEINNYTALTTNTDGIVIPELYQDLEPKKDGLLDPRLGPVDHHAPCATCLLSSKNCPGHFGHIRLAEAVYHMGYLPYVKRVLSCVCLKCSKLLVNKNTNNMKYIAQTKIGKSRLLAIVEATKNATYCSKQNNGCGTPVSKIRIEQKKSVGTVYIIVESNIVQASGEGNEQVGYSKKKITQIFSPEEVYRILDNISDEDCRILGFDPIHNHPKDMIHKIFPVPPVAIRPSIRADYLASSSGEDDLTRKLADIVKANSRVMKDKETENGNIGENKTLVQYHIGAYYDNESMGTLRSEHKGRPTKSLSERLKSKEGRIRSNLMGRRRN